MSETPQTKDLTTVWKSLEDAIFSATQDAEYEFHRFSNGISDI